MQEISLLNPECNLSAMKTNITTAIAVFCSLFMLNPSAFAQSLEAWGLEGKLVTSLSFSPRTLSQEERLLYAATFGDGIFCADVLTEPPDWQLRGFAGKDVTAIFLYIWGMGPAEFQTLFAGFQPQVSVGDSALLFFSTASIDTPWTRADSGLSVTEISRINAIDGIFFTGNSPPKPRFMVAGGSVYGSFGFALNSPWQKILTLNGGEALALRVEPRLLAGDVWAGGQTESFSSWVAKSEDEGRNWQLFSPNLSGLDAIHAIAINHENRDIVFAATSHSIIVTRDGGMNWSVAGLQDESVMFRDLEIAPDNSRHLFAGGFNKDSLFVFFETRNGGENWQSISPPVSVRGITSLAISKTAPEAVYIGTYGNGVWRYKDLSTGVESKLRNGSAALELLPSFPNPMIVQNIASTGVTIAFNLPKEMAVRVTIYNLLGEEVLRIADGRFSAGQHHLNWTGRNNFGQRVGSGVYIYRAHSGSVSATRKILLLR